MEAPSSAAQNDASARAPRPLTPLFLCLLVLHDSQVEILEINENNSGRDPFPVFLRRSALPKVLVHNTTTVAPK